MFSGWKWSTRVDKLEIQLADAKRSLKDKDSKIEELYRKLEAEQMKPSFAEVEEGFTVNKLDDRVIERAVETLAPLLRAEILDQLMRMAGYMKADTTHPPASLSAAYDDRHRVYHFEFQTSPYQTRFTMAGREI